jgi:hypothetical protein
MQWMRDPVSFEVPVAEIPKWLIISRFGVSQCNGRETLYLFAVLVAEIMTNSDQAPCVPTRSNEHDHFMTVAIRYEPMC